MSKFYVQSFADMIITSSSNIRPNGIFFDVQESCSFYILLRYSPALDDSVCIVLWEDYKDITFIQIGDSDVLIHRNRYVKTVLSQYLIAISVVMQW